MIRILKLLFVCTANIDRSPTGEDIYRGQPEFEAKLAGTEDGYATVPLSKELIEWSDIIFCMERHHRSGVLKINRQAAKKTVVLDIQDHYYRNQPELVNLIKYKVSKYLQSASANRTVQ
jgi:predicted protein tyrosine phosphatase